MKIFFIAISTGSGDNCCDKNCFFILFILIILIIYLFERQLFFYYELFVCSLLLQ